MGAVMEKIAIAIAITGIAALIGTPALAAAPVYSWTGFYIGANAGFSFGRDPSTITDASLGQAIESFDALPYGPVGGGQIGYNWQFSPNWVVGFEGDFQGAAQNDRVCVGAGCSNPGNAIYFTDEQNLFWFATARARLGYTGSPWLWYVTGGGAWGEIHNDFRTFTPTDAAFAANFNLSGWTVGGGLEWHLGGPWTAKLEYLYMDLGSFTDGGFDPISRHTFLMTSAVRDNIVRIGLNYQLH